MFTGIITHIGTLSRLQQQGDWELCITVPEFTSLLAIGASVACSGVCLTVTSKTKDGFTVQASHETLSKTTLGNWGVGTHINLERALKVGDELGGHFVSGHVDGVANVKAITAIADSWKIDFAAPEALARFIATKGSVTLDGISLTVNDVKENDFSVNIIPHTWQNTTIATIREGSEVNLEIDIIARYLQRLHPLSS